ncbi:hypothetical protein ACIQU1_06740 [Streptomyces angustmyceticus]|uniref:hypothetical protein n=1 Tax=Streptomyces angustmyceticus TaxID=285578 RepID=UPI0037F59CD5
MDVHMAVPRVLGVHRAVTGHADPKAYVHGYGSGCVHGRVVLPTSLGAVAAVTAITAITAVALIALIVMVALIVMIVMVALIVMAVMVVIMAGIVVMLRTVRMGAVACHMAYRGTPTRLRLLP